jgi:hypothetical protein
MNLDPNRKAVGIGLLVIVCMVVHLACSKTSREMAGKGAATGALAGSVGGLVSSLIFGGNPAEAAARGAVWGASTGAVTGAVVGSEMDRAQKAQRDKEIEQLKREIGEDAFNGLADLAECNHSSALNHAKKAEAQENRDYALAGLWLEILIYADRREESRARALFPELMVRDSHISSETQAEDTMRRTLQQLMDIREAFNLPRVCG